MLCGTPKPDAPNPQRRSMAPRLRLCLPRSGAAQATQQGGSDGTVEGTAERAEEGGLGGVPGGGSRVDRVRSERAVEPDGRAGGGGGGEWLVKRDARDHESHQGDDEPLAIWLR